MSEMIGKFVKGSTKAIRLLNQRAFTILLFVAGIAAATQLVPSVLMEGVTKREAFGILLMVFLPYLIMKGIILILLLILDISINFSAKREFQYRINSEKVKARVVKLFVDKNISFTKVDNFEFGIERYFVAVMQRLMTGTKFSYPSNIISNKPFAVTRVYDLKNGNTQVKVLYEEEKEAEIIGRLIVATLEAASSEEKRETAPDFMEIKKRKDEKAAEGVQLRITNKGEEPQKTGIVEKIRRRGRRK